MEKEYQLILAELKLIRIELQSIRPSLDLNSNLDNAMGSLADDLASRLIVIRLSIWAVTLEFASKITFKSLSLPSSPRLAVTFSKASVRIFSKSIIPFTPFQGNYNTDKNFSKPIDFSLWVHYNLIVPQRIEVKPMGISKGTKLTDNPKNTTFKVRLDEETSKRLEIVSSKPSFKGGGNQERN